ELGGESNYFVGKEASGWHTHIPTYGRVRYGGVYPGVDLEYYGRQGEVEYDFIVGAGSDAGRLGLGIEGVERMEVDRGGDLVLQVGGGELRWRRPEAYQELGGERRRVEAGYVVHDGKEVGFSLGAYDHHAPLIIDPVLTYATYLGGTGGDVAYGIAVDASGNAYITGITNSTDFPTAGAEQGSNAGSGDVFVTKLNPSGTALVYSTYLGGNGADTAAALAVDASGDVFITGSTTSANFPTTTGAFQTTYGGGGDAFVTQLNSAGNKLVYSSYLGGRDADFGQGIAVDTSGHAYLTGSTQSADFPLMNPLQGTTGGGSDAFVTEFSFA